MEEKLRCPLCPHSCPQNADSGTYFFSFITGSRADLLLVGILHKIRVHSLPSLRKRQRNKETTAINTNKPPLPETNGGQATTCTNDLPVYRCGSHPTPILCGFGGVPSLKN